VSENNYGLQWVTKGRLFQGLSKLNFLVSLTPDIFNRSTDTRLSMPRDVTLVTDSVHEVVYQGIS
jgi:hypothetical protein